MKTIRFKSAVTLMFILSCLFVTTQLSAQEKQRMSPEERAKSMTEKMKTDLVLTDAQYQPVYDINLKYAQKNQEIMKGSSSREEKMKAIKASNDEKDQELKGVLTDEQYTKYLKNKDEKKAKAKERKLQNWKK